MIERLISHFDSLFLEIKAINNLILKENHTKSEALEVALRTCSLAKNPCSEILAIHSIYLSKENDDYNQLELALYIHQLLRKHNLVEEFTVLRKPSNHKFGRLIDLAKVSSLFSTSPPSTDEYFDEIAIVKSKRSVKSLLQLAIEYFAKAQYLLQEDILNHIAIKSYIPKPYELKERSEYEIEYYNKWINGTVKFSDLGANSYYDFIDYFYEQKLSNDQLEIIEARQLELFKEGLSWKTNSLIQDIKDLEEPKVSLLVNLHISLLERFLEGDIDELLIARINKFIKIDNPKEVLLEYDELINSDYYDYHKLVVYEVGRYRKYSPTFTANLIYAYLQILKSPLAKTELNRVKSKNKVQTKNERIAFHFKGDPEQLKFALTTLQHQIDLLKNSDLIESFVSLLLSNDILNEKIRIDLDCETQQFAYIINRLKPYFSKLTAKGIEETKSFYSKNGVLITANNLHGRPPKGVKQQEAIDKIIHQMK